MTDAPEQSQVLASNQSITNNNATVDSAPVSLSDDEALQKQRYENLKSLLAKSSRYSGLLLVKVRRDEKKASHANRGRKRRPEEPSSGGNNQKRAVNKTDSSLFTKEELEGMAAKEPVDEVEDSHDHLQEFDTPKSFTGELRGYQKHGMNWLSKLYLNGMNGILADEMGLGKTIQVIAHFCNLLQNGVSGPFLVIAPMSTLKNWEREVHRFAPTLHVMLYYGVPSHRTSLQAEMNAHDHVSRVLLTSYDLAMRDRAFLSKFSWTYIVVDEGHRLKNMNCKLLHELAFYSCQNKLLLTGTPLHNNLTELWSLLHFLMPSIFSDLESFNSWLDYNSLSKQKDSSEGLMNAENQENHVLNMVHQILTPFLLRRIKTEVDLDLPEKRQLLVFCPMSEIQLRYYKLISERTIVSIVNRGSTNAVDKIDYEHLWEGYGRNKRQPLPRQSINVCGTTRFRQTDDGDAFFELKSFKHLKMTNFMILLKKVCNHPFMIHNPHDHGDPTWYPDYVSSSGKMQLLCKMLVKLHATGHKVLIFSQWTSILDLIEDSISNLGLLYCRLDGSTSLDSRQAQMEEFNRPGSNMSLFMLTTRAGGLGINLTAADTVVIFDSDWNPQMDLQAQDRCHRIGQTRPVVVYRFVTEDSMDEEIVKRATAKRKLEQVVLTKGRFSASQHALTKKIIGAAELQEILQRHEAMQVNFRDVSSEMVDRLLDRDAIFGGKEGDVFMQEGGNKLYEFVDLQEEAPEDSFDKGDEVGTVEV